MTWYSRPLSTSGTVMTASKEKVLPEPGSGKVAMNTCISAQKKEKKHSKGRSDLDIASIDIKVAPKEDRQIKMLHDRIAKLGVFDRAIILLWLEDLSYEEIGEIVGIAPNAVGVRLVRIREQLKNM